MDNSFAGYISTKEAAARSGVHQAHVRLLARTGRIEGFKSGRDWFIAVGALDEYVAGKGWYRNRRKKRRMRE
jgi:excisionase family DNA binding protein